MVLNLLVFNIWFQKRKKGKIKEEGEELAAMGEVYNIGCLLLCLHVCDEKQQSVIRALTPDWYLEDSALFSSVQFSHSRVRFFATPWITARQASLSITSSRSLLKLMSIKSVMPSSHLILCRPLLLPPIPPSIRVFSSESTLHMRWPKYWSFSIRKKHKLESRLPGEISITSDMQMTPPLGQKVKSN